MFTIGNESRSPYTFLGLFSGAGGLDLGFEKAGFNHISSIDILPCAVSTLKHNRPNWNVLEGDVREYVPTEKDVDVLLAGFPCQGFSLGGHRDVNDSRNTLYREVIRITKAISPRVVVMENVLNLRTMIHPVTQKPFCNQIADEMEAIGYKTVFQSFRVSQYGVPQTRRRFIFIACREDLLRFYKFPEPGKETPIRPFLYELGQNLSIDLPNHNPIWGFSSTVHKQTNEPYTSDEIAIPVRFSRTASEGTPIRSFDQPFPAVDTATLWGWAIGNVQASRIEKNRFEKDAMFVRNKDSNAKLWRIQASQLRQFTHREYARLQTFPDDWIFCGDNHRDIHLQIGNAVPVEFAKRIATSVRMALEMQDGIIPVCENDRQLSLFD